MYLTMYQGYNLLTSDDEIKPQLEWIIPESPSPDYPLEVESCGDNGSINEVICSKDLLKETSWKKTCIEGI